MNQYKPRIHFILPGGGLRGAFQAGFMFNLFNLYNSYFEIARIDGTSVGALNGFAIINKKYENLKNIWTNINDINDLFGNWSDNFIIGTISSCIQGFYNNGIFSHNKLKQKIINNSKDSWDNFNTDYKNLYSCPVVNLTNASVEYIYGSNENIVDYVTASASPWIISNPVTINNTLYTDGCLLETYPIKHVDKCNADITVIVGYDQEHIKYIPGQNNNMLHYLANLIDISRFNSVNNHKTREIINNPDMICIANPMSINFDKINKETINDGFDIGIDFANTFFNTYIKNYNNDQTK